MIQLRVNRSWAVSQWSRSTVRMNCLNGLRRLATFSPRPLNSQSSGSRCRASVIPEADMLRELLEISGYQAWCCGFANRKPNGEIIRTTRNFHLDHIDPKSKEGTSNDIVNRAPLCPYHNIKKGNERIGLAEYRVKIADEKELMVDKFGDLQDLNEARHKANMIFAREVARRQGL